MTRDDFETLGNRHKAYEAHFDSALMPGLPVIVRLDGRAFHTFTKGLRRPYDERLSYAMVETTKHLVKEWNATIGYTQSDEITIGFANIDPEIEFVFGGRIQKIVALMAASASVKFNNIVKQYIPEKASETPLFDARIFQYPNLQLAAENFLWRETDATRNSLTMAAHSVYSTKDLHKAGYSKKHELLAAKGINWNDYPTHFKRGVYVGKSTVMKTLSVEEQERIPPKHRGELGKQFARSVIEVRDLPPVAAIANPIEVLFFNTSPHIVV